MAFIQMATLQVVGAHHGLDRRAERAKVSLADQSPKAKAK
jgi:hypothetical protein